MDGKVIRRDTITITTSLYKRELDRQYKAGYDKGYKDAQYFLRSYSPGYDENENDENFND